MASPLTKAQFQARTVMPASFIDEIEAVIAGWTLTRLDMNWAWIEARLRKRYAVPFTAPVPDCALGWLVAMTTWDAWNRRGHDPDDKSIEQAKSDYDEAKREVAEAANAVDGLFDLPLRQDLTTSGVVRSGPYVYSEASPYVWADVQRGAGRTEDGNGSGT